MANPWDPDPYAGRRASGFSRNKIEDRWVQVKVDQPELENRWEMMAYEDQIGKIIECRKAIPVWVEMESGEKALFWTSCLILAMGSCGNCDGPVWVEDYLCRKCRVT